MRQPPSAGAREGRLLHLIDLHFHPEHGSRYWLRKQEELGWAVRDRVRCLDDLWRLGPGCLDDLRRFPILDFIPQAFHRQRHRFIVGETAGTTGQPRAAAYRADEFQAAFIDPFLHVVQVSGFPRGEPWLWVGPSGPHIIGKVVRELARQTGCMDPFSVDFDPRWAKRLAQGTLAHKRYLDHVTEQALDVLDREEINVLFITPPALDALMRRMSDRQRERIHGIHYGGMSMTPQTVNDFRTAFPEAVHLAGYGNTLFGVLMEVEDNPRTALEYFPLGHRLSIHVVGAKEDPSAWPPPLLPPGETGWVLFHRLDESCLLVGMVERDEAERVAPSELALFLGAGDGLSNPRSPEALKDRLQVGIY
jgi:hypothetical protein